MSTISYIVFFFIPIFHFQLNTFGVLFSFFNICYVKCTIKSGERNGRTCVRACLCVCLIWYVHPMHVHIHVILCVCTGEKCSGMIIICMYCNRIWCECVLYLFLSPSSGRFIWENRERSISKVCGIYYKPWTNTLSHRRS